LPIVAQTLFIDFGKAVKRARSLKGWELNDVANRIAQAETGNPGSKAKAPGRSFLSDIEKGKRQISPPTVGKLIRAYLADLREIVAFHPLE
jgi:transcriptional regulator with XRE-family HTH domain